MLLGVPQRTPTSEVYGKLNWVPLENRWKYNRCVMVSKCLNESVPEYLRGTFSTTSDVHNYGTRASSTNKLHIDYKRTKSGQRTFVYSGANDYNSLPVTLRECANFRTFKSDLKKLLL